MTDHLVTHLSMATGSETITGITDLAGPGWRMTRQEVVEAIEKEEDRFFFAIHGISAEVAIVRGALGDYLSAKVGGLWTRDLLSLPKIDADHDPSPPVKKAALPQLERAAAD